jgi:hypothetical protein
LPRRWVAEVAARGAAYRESFEGQFVTLLRRIVDVIRHDEPIAALRYRFDTAFAACVVGVAYPAQVSLTSRTSVRSQPGLAKMSGAARRITGTPAP